MKKQHKFLFKIIILLCCGLTNHLSAMDQLTGTVTFLTKGSQRFQVRFYSGKKHHVERLRMPWEILNLAGPIRFLLL